MLKINMLKHVENLTGSEGKSIFTSPLKHEGNHGWISIFRFSKRRAAHSLVGNSGAPCPTHVVSLVTKRGFCSAGRRGFRCSMVAFLCIYISRLQCLWILGFPSFISRCFSRIEGIQITYIITECTPVNSLYFTVCMWPKLEKSCWPTTMGSSCFTLKRPQKDMWNLNICVYNNICCLNIHSIEYSGGFMKLRICWNDENLCETSMHDDLRPSYETFTWPGTPVAKEFPPTKIGAPTPKLPSRARPQKRQADKCVDLGRSSENHFPAIFICILIIINQSLSSIKSSSTFILSMLGFPKKCLKILQQMIDNS